MNRPIRSLGLCFILFESSEEKGSNLGCAGDRESRRQRDVTPQYKIGTGNEVFLGAHGGRYNGRREGRKSETKEGGEGNLGEDGELDFPYQG